MFHDKISAGTVWLDKYQPGWTDRINLETLNMLTCSMCVLGQLFGDYNKVGNDRAPSYDERRRLGFIIRAPLWSHDWTRLTNEWKAVIAARQTAKVPA